MLLDHGTTSGLGEGDRVERGTARDSLVLPTVRGIEAWGDNDIREFLTTRRANSHRACADENIGELVNTKDI